MSLNTVHYNLTVDAIVRSKVINSVISISFASIASYLMFELTAPFPVTLKC